MSYDGQADFAGSLDEGYRAIRERMAAGGPGWQRKERNMEFHSLANIFPLIDGTDFDDLVADIREHGVREPIWLYDGQIIDGRNRYRASHVAGVDCPMRVYDGDDPVSFVVSLNLKRRHLDESQRAMVAGRLATLQQGARTDLSPIGEMSQGRAAELLNVGKRSVERAREVLDDGALELITAVERGRVSVSAAADIASKPQDEQREIVARGEKEIIAAANAIKRERKEQARTERHERAREAAASVPAIADRYQLHHGPCADALSLEPNSVDLIITDPPYPAEFLPVYDELGKVGAHVLKPGGLAIIMIGHSYLPEIINMMGAHLNYHWIMSYLVPGGQAAQQFDRRANALRLNDKLPQEAA